VVNTLDKKLFRDLSRMGGQVVTIALVVAAGIAGYVTMRGTYASLTYSKDAYYERYRMGDVFAHLARAPSSVADQLLAVEGVATVYPRVLEVATIPVETLAEPASGHLVSVPAGSRPLLNDLYIREGRYLDPARTDEVLVLESFAAEHELAPGDRLPVVINGILRHLVIAGIAMSPEYVFPMPVGGISADAKRFAVLWMNEDALSAAFEMEGAFDDVVLRLQPGASEAAVLADVDRILEPWGGLGAVSRSKQQSNMILEGELLQLANFANVVPFIFLGVAAFLLNVVLSRMVHLQRSQIAALKAVGYPDRAIGFHYMKLVTVIVILGAVIGVAGGSWLGRAFTEMYTMYFRFPMLVYRLDPMVAATGIGISLFAALVGALAAARRVARLPPAEAMRPPAPLSFKPTLLERSGFHRLLSPGARMVLREIERRPFRLILSSVGVSMAVAIMIVGRFNVDAMEQLIRVQFHEAWGEDVSVTFLGPVPDRAVRDLAHLPGVLHVEGMRSVPVRFRNEHHFRDSVIMGYQDGGTLRRPLDSVGNETILPGEGVVLSRKLAEILEVHVGETVVTEIREGDRAVRELLVADVIDDSFGLMAYMRLSTLQSFLREEAVVTQGLMRIDPLALDDIQNRLKEMPAVQSVLRKQTIIDMFHKQSADIMIAMTAIMTLFAAVIAVGVVYNNARVALSMRARDLGSLRVLGFSRREISAILLGELAVQLVLAVPIGLYVGTWMVQGIMDAVDPEQYRLPVIIQNRTYAYAAVVALASGFASALLVRRKLDKLDLIAVLKTRT